MSQTSDRVVSPSLPNLQAGLGDTSHEATNPSSATKRHPSPPVSRTTPPASTGPRTKRKRLAKACDSCHKSKRRCDGTSPCANCDFAGKACVYTDSAGRSIDPPVSKAAVHVDNEHRHQRRKTTALTAIGTVPNTPNGSQASYDSPPPSGQIAPRWSQPPSSVHPPATDSLGELNSHAFIHRANIGATADQRPVYASHTKLLEPGLTKELVNLFFAHMHPYNLVLHRPTFLIDLADSRIPPHLLLVVFALAAPLSVQPKIRTNPPWHAGEPFAQAAMAELFDHDGSLKQKGTIEVAQTLALLTMHECVVRRPNQTDVYFRGALRVLEDLGIHGLDKDPVASAALDQTLSPREWIFRESCRRLFYLIYVIELLSAVFTRRPLSYTEKELRVFLPVDEATFSLVLTNNPTPREYLVQTQRLPDGQSSIAEFGFLVRATTYYAKINGYLRERSGDIARSTHDSIQSAGTPTSVRECEQYLHIWEKSLPEHLRFNEDNLHIHVSTLENGGGVEGWCYCYMHALVECGVLCLHESLELDGDREALRNHTSRQQRALDNLTIILGSLGTRGRLSIMMATILLAVVKHRVSLSGQPDPHVTTWCAEYESLWGVNLDQMMSIEFRKSWVPSFPPDQMAPSRYEEPITNLKQNPSSRSSLIGPNAVNGKTQQGARLSTPDDGGTPSASGLGQPRELPLESSRPLSPSSSSQRHNPRLGEGHPSFASSSGSRSSGFESSRLHTQRVADNPHRGSESNDMGSPVTSTTTTSSQSVLQGKSPASPRSDPLAHVRNHSLPPLHTVGLLDATRVPEPSAQHRMLPRIGASSRTSSPGGRSFFPSPHGQQPHPFTGIIRRTSPVSTAKPIHRREGSATSSTTSHSGAALSSSLTTATPPVPVSQSFTSGASTLASVRTTSPRFASLHEPSGIYPGLVTPSTGLSTSEKSPAGPPAGMPWLGEAQQGKD